MGVWIEYWRRDPIRMSNRQRTNQCGQIWRHLPSTTMTREISPEYCLLRATLTGSSQETIRCWSKARRKAPTSTWENNLSHRFTEESPQENCLFEFMILPTSLLMTCSITVLHWLWSGRLSIRSNLSGQRRTEPQIAIYMPDRKLLQILQELL